MQKPLDTGMENLFAREWKTENGTLRIYVNANRKAVKWNGNSFAPLEVKIEENGVMPELRRLSRPRAAEERSP